MISIGATFVTALALAGSPAAPSDDYARGVEAWAEEDWTTAAEAFARALERDPKPEIAWAHAQALRFGGRCEEAIPAYERFIALTHEASDVEDARINIARCRAELGPGPPHAESAPAGAPEAREPGPVAPMVLADPRPWYRDRAGMVMLALGVAAAGVGTGLTIHAHTRVPTPVDRGTEDRYRDYVRHVRVENAIGISCLAIGGALIIGSAVRLAVVARRGARVRIARVRGGLAAITVAF
jgi:tetratricopeptide (TPR) repeat protein